MKISQQYREIVETVHTVAIQYSHTCNHFMANCIHLNFKVNLSSTPSNTFHTLISLLYGIASSLTGSIH